MSLDLSSPNSASADDHVPVEPSDVLVEEPKRPRIDQRTVDPIPSVGQDKRPSGNMSAIVFPKRGDLPALDRCRSPKFARVIARILIGGLIATIVLMAFSPWQQTVKGSGDVTNFDPKLRPQIVQAPISGRVVRLGDGIRENVFVKKGDLIAQLADVDPMRLQALEAQKDATERSLQAARDALTFANSELIRFQELVTVYESNVNTVKRAQEQSIGAANVYLDAAKKARDAAEQLVNDQTAQLELAEQNFKRQKTLFEDNIASEFVYQKATQEYESAQAKLAKAKADLAVAEQEIAAKERERDRVIETTEAEVEIATSRLNGTQAQIEAARAKVSTAEQKVQDLTAKLASLESDVRRQSTQDVVATIDGTLNRIYADAGSSFVAQGAPVARIVPDSTDRVVQIWLDGNDAPLVSDGDHVRLQFEGWPAIQFAGWPSVAVGTFGGEVISVDATDDVTGKYPGKFRMLVREVSGKDEESGLVEEPWPQGKFLRPGVQAKAWVLLEVVPLWWEVWRNLNGFPPVVDVENTERPKTPKTPKL